MGAHRDNSARAVRNMRTQQSNKGKRDAAKRRKRQEQAWAAKSGPVVTRQMTDEERDR